MHLRQFLSCALIASTMQCILNAECILMQCNRFVELAQVGIYRAATLARNAAGVITVFVRSVCCLSRSWSFSDITYSDLAISLLLEEFCPLVSLISIPRSRLFLLLLFRVVLSHYVFTGAICCISYGRHSRLRIHGERPFRNPLNPPSRHLQPFKTKLVPRGPYTTQQLDILICNLSNLRSTPLHTLDSFRLCLLQ